MHRSVIHLADFASPYSGNFISALLSLQDPLRVRGLDLVLAFPQSASECKWLREVRQKVRVELLPTQPGLHCATQIAALVRRVAGCVLHTHFCKYDLIASIARGLVTSDLRVVWHTHSPLSSSRLRRVRSRTKYILFGRNVKVISVSEPILRQVLACGCKQRNAVCIENGVDLCRVARSSMTREAFAAAAGVPSSDFIALIFGWDPFRKGVDVAIRAVELARENGLNLSLLIISGPDAMTRDWIANRVGPLPPFIRVIPPMQTVADLYRNVDVFLSLSRAEGMTYSVIEAMAAEKPVLISDINGQDWARGVEGAILVPPCDIRQSAAALLRLARSSPDTFAARGARNRREAEKHSITNWAEKVCSIYDEMLHSSADRLPCGSATSG